MIPTARTIPIEAAVKKIIIKEMNLDVA